MAKNKIFAETKDVSVQFEQTCHQYRNKYFNLYKAGYKWTGLNYRQIHFIMKEFYAKGTVAAFKIKGLDEIGFAPWQQQSLDIYDEVETCMLINKRGVKFIPSTVQVVDKDVVLGWLQHNRKPLVEIVEWYIQRIAQVEMVINTNLNLHKMPFLISIDTADKKKADDIVKRILNNEVVILADGIDPNLIKAVVTNTPYIIDKLQQYKQALENELKTILGCDNAGQIQKSQFVNLDETNANNAEINDFADNNYLTCLQEFCDRIQEVFGVTISVESTSQIVDSIGEYHEGDKPGPEGEQDD